MNNDKKPDMTALAVFFPAVAALAIIPILMHATYVVTTLKDTFMIFTGTEMEDGTYRFIDVYSQCKAFAVVLFSLIMIFVALVCCVFLFRRAEKRSLAIVGASVVYVGMTLASALMSDYGEVAFNGQYDRAEGFYTTACYFVMFLFTMYAFRKEQNFKPVAIALFFCVGVNAIFGIFQFTGNNLEAVDWFATLIIDRDYSGELESVGKLGTQVYGALYHYNYVGSFTGLVIPLFTTMALFEKKAAWRIAYIVFDLAAVFLLLGSTARSGIVAVLAAALVGIVVFFRVIIKHWKISVSVVGAAAVALVGANVALDGAILRRIPSIFTDVIELVQPAKEGQNLFSQIPVREIKQSPDGVITFVTQDDELNVAVSFLDFSYVMYDKDGNTVSYTKESDGYLTINDERYKGIVLELFSSEDTYGEYDDFLFFRMNTKNSYPLTFYFTDNGLKQVDPKTNAYIRTENAEAIGFEGKEKVGSGRGYIWSRTIPLLKNCLVTGYGADTFAYYFPQNDFLAKYYAYDGEMNMIVDKVHNMYVQTLFSNGLIALIAMLFIFVWYLVDSLRLYALRKEYRETQIYGAAVMLAVVGYLAAGMFNDP
ncbi:MAG: O-antigen ligase family protein, partial [Oscillospiraceae bacterium]